MGNIRHVARLLKEAVVAYHDDGAMSRGAAISFYAMTATAPILYIAAMIAGIVIGPEVARSGITHEIGRAIGHDSAKLLYTAIHNSADAQGGAHFIANLFSTVLLLVTAVGMFLEIQSALNAIWRTQPEGHALLTLLRDWFASLALVLGVAFLLLASLVFNTMISALGDRIDYYVKVGGTVARLLNLGISSLLIGSLFAAIYRLLPNRDLQWRDVVAGAVATTLLVQAGEYGISLYLGTVSVGYRYGSAGGVIAVLMWIYYTVQVFLLGAEFTKVWSQRYGSPAARAVTDAPPPAETLRRAA